MRTPFARLIRVVPRQGSAGVKERLTFNFPSWSLSAEMFCYLLFPLVALIAQRRKEAVIALVALTALANSLWVWAAGTTPWADWINQGGAFRALPAFNLGMACCPARWPHRSWRSSCSAPGCQR